MSRLPLPRRFCLTALTLLLATGSGVALAAPLDGGVAELQSSTQSLVLGTPDLAVELPRPGLDTRAEVSTLLKSPLTAEAAVRIAVLNNPELQRELGAAGWSISDASAANNPVKMRVRQSITILSSKAYKAWVSLVAAEQAVTLMQQAKDTLQTTGELSRRMTKIGNLSKLNQAHAQLALSEAAIALAQAQRAAFSARESLVVILGLWGDQIQFAVPPELPPLPAQAQQIANVEERALSARADLGVTTAQWQRKLATSVPGDIDERWDTLADAATVRAEAVQIRSQARQVYFAYRSGYDLAQHLQTDVLPLRNFIHDEMVLRYNGMLISIFDVLADTQAGVATAKAVLSAQRDFWFAHADLQALLMGAPVEAGGSAQTSTGSGAMGAGAGPAH
jgi:multidrug efflux system outer membrane protein